MDGVTGVIPRFDNKDGHMKISEISGVPVPKCEGQYTLKHYMIASMIPSFLKAILPSDSLYLVEESWNCHPYCLTVVTNGYLSKDRFRVSVESKHVDSDVWNWNELPCRDRSRISSTCLRMT